MIQINEITYVADEGYIFTDEETETINHGPEIQIGTINVDGNIVDDDINNYVEVLESDFFEKSRNTRNYIANFEE